MNKSLYQAQKGVFNHTHEFSGYAGDVPYLNYKKGGGIIDGIQRQHINLYARCNICNKEILVARTHVNNEGKLYGYE